jgi:transcriptional regulator with GAF, ATPase, and Fis domain/response regulator of citrate/malate metabolism
MKENILIVEDEFIVANDLRLMLVKSGYNVCGIAATVSAAQRMIEKHRPTWVLLDIFLQDESMGTDLAQQLVRENIGFIYISANTNQTILEKAKATQPYGFLVKPFRENDLLVMLDIALHKHQENLEMIAQRELLLHNQLQQIAGSTISAEEKLAMLPLVFQGFIPFDFISVNIGGRKEEPNTLYGFFRKGFNDYTMLKNQELQTYLDISPGEMNRFRITHPQHQQTGFANSLDYRRLLPDDIWERRLSSFLNIQSRLHFVADAAAPRSVSLSFHSQKDESYNVSHVGMLQQIKACLTSILTLGTPLVKQQRPLPKTASMAPIPEAEGFEGMIGSSPLLLKVLDNIKLVAATPVSVLILGESGTGKERVAQAIHRRSPRHNKQMIVVNCAALAPELVESELFGHEKGAFTGAIDKRAGKFEAADGGTIFLDEIGELSLDAQVKLLRVLQEREFERVGGSKTIKVDVRVIAATNRNLEKEVAEGRLRLDLYYRLNVFPIELPPLRERKGDIPLLAQHFISRFSATLNKHVMGLSQHALMQLSQYNWPGNIRELEHLIERSVLMARGAVIEHVHMSTQPTIQYEQRPATGDNSDQPLKTLKQNEMDHIIEVLRKCGGKITGPGGAAEVLGLPPSTLNSKLKKFGIKRAYDF